ncbi:MAG: zinc ribbon domain-containing protein, partial [Terracidiphilus sp.]
MASPAITMGSTGVKQAGPDVAHGPDNPMVETPEQQDQKLQFPTGYKEKMVETITLYRNGWAPDRLLRIPGWMRNVLMFRGSQLIEFDPGSNSYVDVLAWNRQNGKAEAEDTYLEKYSNNITQMLEGGFSSVIAGAVPSVIVKPENAEILADVTTAKASQEAISIIERMNNSQKQLLSESNNLYLYGVYFRHTRAVLDGDWAGWDYEDVFGEVPNQKPDRYHCYQCGTDTPADQLQQGQAKQCPKCGAPLGTESFFPADSTQEMAITGQKRVPRAMVKWSIHGPMEIDVDPQAHCIEETPTLSFDREIDIGALRLTYPAIFEEIKEGAELGTTPNASYEKLRRNEVTSMGWGYTSDSQNQKPTLSQNWMQPSSYGRIGDKQFAQWMHENFSDGVKVTLIGSLIADVRKANLPKEWSACLLHENVGMYPPSIADNVVPFNIRLNDTLDLIDDWIERCAAGMTIYDSNKIDRREMAGRVMSPGVLNGIQTKGAGVDKPLGDSIMQFEFKLDPQVFSYPNMLIQMCELISGVTPQTFGGGGQEGIETKGGQEQALNTALNKLNIFWKMVKEEHAQGAQNALECLQKLMKAGAVGEIWDVIQANGSEFRNNYVNWNKMQGHIKVYQDVDQGLPQTPEQIRDTMMNFVKMASEKNPIAMEIMSVVPNQESAIAVLGTPGMVLPTGAQRSRTLQAINTLMENDYIAVADPQTGQQVNQLPIMP